MANFISTVTQQGLQELAWLVAQGERLLLVQAKVGTGTAGDPLLAEDLAAPAQGDVHLSEPEYSSTNPNLFKIPVQVTNSGLEEPLPVREIGVFAQDREGREFLFLYSHLEGPDGDNVLPPPGDPEFIDTIHIHDVAVVLTHLDSIEVSVGGGSYVTYAQMEAYAATRDHTHKAAEIEESTGESTEVAQRRQDYAIQALQDQLNTGFTGTTVLMDFSPAQIDQWYGYDGEGLPEGVWDSNAGRLYV